MVLCTISKISPSKACVCLKVEIYNNIAQMCRNSSKKW